MAAFPIYQLASVTYEEVMEELSETRGELEEQIPGTAWSYRNEVAMFAVGRFQVYPRQTSAQLEIWLKENEPEPKPPESKPADQLTFLDPAEFGGGSGPPANKPEEIRGWIREMRAAGKRAARAGPWGSYAEAKAYQSAFAKVMKGMGKTRKDYKTKVLDWEAGVGHYLDFMIKGV